MITLAAPSKTFNLAAGQNSLVLIPDEKLRRVWDEYTTANRVISGMLLDILRHWQRMRAERNGWSRFLQNMG